RRRGVAGTESGDQVGVRVAVGHRGPRRSLPARLDCTPHTDRTEGPTADPRAGKPDGTRPAPPRTDILFPKPSPCPSRRCHVFSITRWKKHLLTSPRPARPADHRDARAVRFGVERLEDRLAPAIIVVSDLLDAAPLHPGTNDPTDINNQISLRSAIAAANAD